MSLLQYINFSIELWGALFCLVALASVLITQGFDKKSSRMIANLMIASALLMISDSLAWMFRGHATEAGYYIVRISNYCAFFFGLLIMPLVAEYVSHLIYKGSGISGLFWEYIEWFLFIFGAVVLTVNIFHPFIYTFDDGNTYYRLTFGFLPGLLAFIGIVATLGVVLEYLKYLQKYEKFAVVTFLLLPLAAVVLQTFRYGISYANIALVISALILFFSYIADYSRYVATREKILTEERLRLVNQQIQPHFIFNTLSVIRHLCLSAPEEAAQAINEFSGYMRSCTDFLNETECIDAERELELVKHYIFLEQKRFGTSISVEYSIEDTDFLVPPFAIQTSVENAIKHGLRSSVIENGKIKISTYKDGEDHVVEIEDNGAGFDTAILKNESKFHVGIRNTQERLKLMCGGDLRIESEPGEGTKVTMTIPS